MSAVHRMMPGCTALTLSFLSAYAWRYTGLAHPSLFTVAHTASAVLCAVVPVAFVLVGRATYCRPDLLKLGAVLLAIAAVPLLIANGVYLFSFGSAEASLGDIGGFGLFLLGTAALVVASASCLVGLAVARPRTTSTSE
jgi:hypothetical protein